MASARVFVLKRLFQGFPTENDFKVVEEKLSALKDGGEFPTKLFKDFIRTVFIEFLAEARYITVDPYMRGFLSHSDVGKTFGGEQVAV